MSLQWTSERHLHWSLPNVLLENDRLSILSLAYDLTNSPSTLEDGVSESMCDSYFKCGGTYVRESPCDCCSALSGEYN